MRKSVALLCVVASVTMAAQQQPNPRQQPGAMVQIYAPEQHDLYDGYFVISANRIYMVGGLNDAEGWDHVDNEAKNLRAVNGTAEIDVNEIQNTGKFEARLKIPEGDLVLAMDRWNEFAPCQNGGIAAYIDAHPSTKPLVRMLLTPLVVVALFLLGSTAIAKSGVAALLGSLALLELRRRKRKAAVERGALAC